MAIDALQSGTVVDIILYKAENPAVFKYSQGIMQRDVIFIQ
jgi:hypothetical protein